VIESASLDGATGWKRFRHFDLPLLMGQIKLMVVFSVIGSLQGFQTQLVLSGGGPGYSTMVPGLHMYQNAMEFDRMGYACAIGTVLFVLILALTYINLRYLKSSTEFEAA
jgi:ABC-type sugar transport system permease subunit